MHVLGPFNNWSTVATPMRRGTDGVWEAELATMPTTEALRFFVWPLGEITGRLRQADEHDA